MSRKFVPVLVFLAVVITACGRTSGKAPNAATQSSLPFERQVLTAGTPGDLYGNRNRVTLGISPDNANICETLVGLSGDLQSIPALATRWTYQGNNTFRFELRRDVKFQNGAPFTAEAVRFTMERVAAKNLAPSPFVGPGSAKVVDDYTVDITPTKPNLRLPDQISSPGMSIIAPGTDPADKPVCTGPFEFVSYQPGERLVVRRFEGYWGEKAKLRELTFRFIPDENTRRLALESGEIDAAYTLPPTQAASVRSNPGLRLAPSPPGASVVLSFNLRGAEPYTILQDPEVRRAVALSLDPKALVDQVWQGTAEVVSTVTPPSVLGPSGSLIKPMTGNPLQAQQILEQKGWTKGADGVRSKGGRRLSLSMLAESEFQSEFLQLVQAQAKDSGIDLRIDRVADRGVYNGKINDGAFDIDVNYFNQSDADPGRLLALLWYSKTEAGRIKFTAPGEKFDKLVEESMASPDTPSAARKAAEAMQVLVNEEAAAIPLTTYPQIYAMKTSVAGFTPHPQVLVQPWYNVFRTA